MAALVKYDDPQSPFCGGTVVASRYVVTAAHCVQQYNSSEIFVRVGEHDLHVVGETNVERRVNVSAIITHEHYDHYSYHNDIAVVYLSEHLDLSLYPPACLARASDSPAGHAATVYGWGTVEFGGDQATELRAVEVPVVPHEECSAAMSRFSDITEAMICAGATNVDACHVSKIIVNI